MDETLEDIAVTGRTFGDQVRKVLVMDGDALTMDLDLWEPVLRSLSDTFPNLRRVRCYATALNLVAKSRQELGRLSDLGLKLLYIGPESGDDITLKRIAKGATSADHVEDAAKARQTGMKQSLIFLLGAGDAERSVEHASARLVMGMGPKFLSTLTLTDAHPFHSDSQACQEQSLQDAERRRCWPPSSSSGWQTGDRANRESVNAGSTRGASDHYMQLGNW